MERMHNWKHDFMRFRWACLQIALIALKVAPSCRKRFYKFGTISPLARYFFTCISKLRARIIPSFVVAFQANNEHTSCRLWCWICVDSLDCSCCLCSCSWLLSLPKAVVFLGLFLLSSLNCLYFCRDARLVLPWSSWPHNGGVSVRRKHEGGPSQCRSPLDRQCRQCRCGFWRQTYDLCSRSVFHRAGDGTDKIGYKAFAKCFTNRLIVIARSTQDLFWMLSILEYPKFGHTVVPRRFLGCSSLWFKTCRCWFEQISVIHNNHIRLDALLTQLLQVGA